MKNKENKKMAYDLNVKIGERLRELREKANLSQAKFIKVMQCQGIDISTSTYSRYEYGESEIPIFFINVFCKYYHVSPDYLINGVEPTSDRKIMQMLSLLNKNEKNMIGKFLHDFARCMDVDEN